MSLGVLLDDEEGRLRELLCELGSMTHDVVALRTMLSSSATCRTSASQLIVARPRSKAIVYAAAALTYTRPRNAPTVADRLQDADAGGARFNIEVSQSQRVPLNRDRDKLNEYTRHFSTSTLSLMSTAVLSSTCQQPKVCGHCARCLRC